MSLLFITISAGAFILLGVSLINNVFVARRVKDKLLRSYLSLINISVFLLSSALFIWLFNELLNFSLIGGYTVSTNNWLIIYVILLSSLVFAYSSMVIKGLKRRK